jgi:hypothetical protein
MNLYRVVFDGEPDYVEAENFTEAIQLWNDNLVETNEPEHALHFRAEQPESVELVHEGAVLRSHKS